MASDDHRQVTTIVARLGNALSLLNPLKLVTTMHTVLHEVSTPPPGDPEALRALAAAFRQAATATDPIAAGVAFTRTGDARPGGEVVRAAAEVVGAGPRVLRDAAVALDRLAERVEAQHGRHAALREALRAAVRDATHVGTVPGPDPSALDDLARAATSLVRGCLDVYTDAIRAADEAAGVFGDLAGRARLAAGMAGGLDPAEAATLAVLPVRIRGIGDAYDDGVLSTAQLGAAGRRLVALPDADRATVRELLVRAASDTERAYLLKAVAAGHGAAELASFAGAIHGHDEDWLHGHLSLVDRGGTGRQDRDGVRVDQCDPYTCGTTSLIVARAESDPVYALQLTGGDPATFDQRLTAEQARVHDRTNLLYPEHWGTTPKGMADWMNQHAPTTGARYGWRLVDDTDRRKASGTLREVVTAVDAGHPVPILVGAAVPRHYVLVVGHSGDDLLIYEPTGGATVRVPTADFLDGRLTPTTGFPHVQAAILPTPTPPQS